MNLKTFKKYSLRKRVFVIGGLLAVGGLVGWVVNRPEPAVVGYQTAVVERGTVVAAVAASGEILSANTFAITTKASGLVSEVFVKDGDEVVKGQPVMAITLDQDGEQELIQKYASYLSAQNSLASAKTRLLSLESTMLSQKQAFDEVKESTSYQTEAEKDDFRIAENGYQAAVETYHSQTQAITQSQSSLQNAWLAYQAVSPNVLAPASGKIVSLSFAAGMNTGAAETSGGARASQRVATIAVGGTPLGSFNLSEIDVTAVAVGQKAMITLDSLSDKTFTGEVVSVDRVGQVTSNVSQYPAVIKFDTASAEILPHMTATANIIIASKTDALLAPISAIVRQNGQDSARVLDGEQESLVPIEIGLKSDTQVEIISGVNEGDILIIGSRSTESSTGGGDPSPFGGGGGVLRMVPH